jgi:hypothetical protein
MKVKFIFILITGLLISCQTSYRAKNIIDGLGYQDEKVQEGVFHISYNVNANTQAQQALSYWHQRATELCGDSNYFADAKLNNKRIYDVKKYQTGGINSVNENGSLVSQPTTRVSIVTGASKFPEATGYAYCQGKPAALIAHKQPEHYCNLKRKLKRNQVYLKSSAAQCDQIKNTASSDVIDIPKKATVIDQT